MNQNATASQRIFLLNVLIQKVSVSVYQNKTHLYEYYYFQVGGYIYIYFYCTCQDVQTKGVKMQTIVREQFNRILSIVG